MKSVRPVHYKSFELRKSYNLMKLLFPLLFPSLLIIYNIPDKA